MKARYYDAENQKPVETRTGNEIIAQMKAKIARIGGGDAESI